VAAAGGDDLLDVGRERQCRELVVFGADDHGRDVEARDRLMQIELRRRVAAQRSDVAI
jgi:hypothetical protein